MTKKFAAQLGNWKKQGLKRWNKTVVYCGLMLEFRTSSITRLAIFTCVIDLLWVNYRCQDYYWIKLGDDIKILCIFIIFFYVMSPMIPNPGQLDWLEYKSSLCTSWPSMCIAISQQMEITKPGQPGFCIEKTGRSNFVIMIGWHKF